MFRKISTSIVLALFFSCFSSVAFSQTDGLFSRYSGVLKHANMEKDQYAKLDFIVSREQGQTLFLRAILTLYFGDFSSKEYVSYAFDNVRYNILTGVLVFGHPSQDMTLLTSNFGGGDFVADVRSSLSGNVGELRLHRDSTVQPTRELIGPLWGEYRGTCNGKRGAVQLQTFRSLADSVRIGNPYARYEIRGQYAEYLPRICPSDDGRYCVRKTFYAGSYNFFSGQLDLQGDLDGLSCRVSGIDELTCGECVYTRVSRETSSFDQTTPKTSTNSLVSGVTDSELQGTSSGLSGTYTGYLHHEYLDQYQTGAINLVAFQDPDGSGLRMSATANLFFGDMSSFESLSYRFAERSYDLLSRSFVFANDGGSGDAVLQISHIGNDRIRGTWFSTIFGKVGSFEFKKGPIDSLPSGLKPLQGVGGVYESQDIELRLNVRFANGEPNPENPFSQLTFGGYLYYTARFAARIPISGGSYDFYTGRIGLTISDGMRVATGLVHSDEQEIDLKLTSNGFGTLLPLHELFRYEFIEGN